MLEIFVLLSTSLLCTNIDVLCTVANETLIKFYNLRQISTLEKILEGQCHVIVKNQNSCFAPWNWSLLTGWFYLKQH